jgi:hypothetical protein
VLKEVNRTVQELKESSVAQNVREKGEGLSTSYFLTFNMDSRGTSKIASVDETRALQRKA